MIKRNLAAAAISWDKMDNVWNGWMTTFFDLKLTTTTTLVWFGEVFSRPRTIGKTKRLSLGVLLPLLRCAEFVPATHLG